MNVSDMVNNVNYNFTTLAPSVLNGAYQDLKLIAKGNYEVAGKYVELLPLFRAVYPYLPPGTPSDYTQHDYLIFENNVVMSTLWIDPSSLAVSSSYSVTIVIPNAQVGDTAKLRDTLSLMGYTNFTINGS